MNRSEIASGLEAYATSLKRDVEWVGMLIKHLREGQQHVEESHSLLDSLGVPAPFENSGYSCTLTRLKLLAEEVRALRARPVAKETIGYVLKLNGQYHGGMDDWKDNRKEAFVFHSKGTAQFSQKAYPGSKVVRLVRRVVR